MNIIRLASFSVWQLLMCHVVVIKPVPIPKLRCTSNDPYVKTCKIISEIIK